MNVPSSLDMVVLHGLEPASTYKLEMISVSQSDTRSMLALSSFSTGESELQQDMNDKFNFQFLYYSKYIIFLVPKSNPPPNRVEPRPEKTPKQNYRGMEIWFIIRVPNCPPMPTIVAFRNNILFTYTPVNGAYYYYFVSMKRFLKKCIYSSSCM